jgi:hypothetical protein
MRPRPMCYALSATVFYDYYLHMFVVTGPARNCFFEPVGWKSGTWFSEQLLDMLPPLALHVSTIGIAQFGDDR